MSRAHRRWALWLATTTVWFTALELPAVAQKRDPDTLSATLRHWLGIHPERRGHRILGILFCLALGWFASHILDPDGKSK